MDLQREGPFPLTFQGAVSWLALLLLGGSTSGEKLGIGQTAYSIAGKQKMKKDLEPPAPLKFTFL